MTIVYFVYGLAFFALGIAVLIYPKKKSSFALAKDLHLIALFGILHGISEWVELYALIKPAIRSPAYGLLDTAILSFSYFFLLLFGAKVLCGPTSRCPALKAAPPVLLLAYLGLLIFLPGKCLGYDIWVRYLLGLPGIVMTGLALHSQVPVFGRFNLASVLGNIRIAAISFYVYAFLSVFAACEVELFPFSLMTNQNFLEATGIPVQLLRAICALTITYALIRMLEIFDWETREALRQAHEGLERNVYDRTAALMKSNVALKEQIDEHRETVRVLRRSEKELMARQHQLRRLASEFTLAETRERRRIASLLHDQVGQTLSAIKMRTGMLAKDLTETAHGPVLREIHTLLDQGIEETRTLTTDLCPPILSEFGLAAALEWLAEQFRDKYHIECRFEDDGQDKPLPASLSTLLFWFTRELLINVIKHAEASRADIAISVDQNRQEVTISVSDDGKGMDASRAMATCFEGRECGFGLFNIRERINYMDGSFLIESRSGQGTRAIMTIPY